MKPKEGAEVVQINGWMQDDYRWRDEIRDQIALDLESGTLAKLTYKIGRGYKLRSDKNIQIVQKQLVQMGHLVKEGRLFKSAYLNQKAA